MQMKSRFTIASCGAICLLPAIILSNVACETRAHGPQLQITNEGGKIVTRNVFLDGPYDTLTPQRQAYVIPVREFNGSWYSRPNNATDILGNPTFFSGPGLAYGLGSTFSANESFEIAFVDGLKLWNGSAYVDPGTEQVQAFRGSPEAPSAVAETSDSGPFAALAFPSIASGYDSEAHSSARFRLLGDGTDPLSDSQDGIYLLTLQLNSSDSTVDPSDPFYFVMHKNASRSSVLAAVDALGVAKVAVQIVPEPSAWSMALVTILVVSPRRGARLWS